MLRREECWASRQGGLEVKVAGREAEAEGEGQGVTPRTVWAMLHAAPDKMHVIVSRSRASPLLFVYCFVFR